MSEEATQVEEIENQTIEPTEVVEPQEVEFKPFSVKLNDKTLLEVLQVAEAIGLEDIDIRYDGRNLYVKQMDPSHVCMVDANVITDTEGEAGDRVFSVSLSSLMKAIKFLEKGTTLNVAKNEVEVIGVSPLSLSARISMPVSESLEVECPEPKIKLDVSAKVNFGEVKKAFEALAEAPETVTFDSAAKALSLTGKNDSQTIVLNGIKSDGEGKAVYSWSLLSDLAKGEWEISYSTDMPMRMARAIRETVYVNGNDSTKTITKERGAITVWLAPRIESR